MQNMLQENPWTLLLQQPPTVVGVVERGEERVRKAPGIECSPRCTYFVRSALENRSRSGGLHVAIGSRGAE